MDQPRLALYETCKPYGNAVTEQRFLRRLIEVEGSRTAVRERFSFRERVAYRLHDCAGPRAPGGSLDRRPGLPVDTRRRGLESALRDLETIVRREGLDALLLKGFVIEALYPEGYRRQFGDIDLLVEDAATAWRIVARLIQAGFEAGPESPLIFGLTGRPDCGVLVKLTRGADTARVEVSSGVAGNGPLPTGMGWEELWAGSEVWTGAGGLRVPALEATAALFLAELYERQRLFVRDLCDWDVLCHQLNERGKTAMLLELIRALTLGPALRRVNRESAAVSRMSREWQTALRSAERAFGPLPRLGYGWAYAWPHLVRGLGAKYALRTILVSWLDYQLRRSRLPGSDAFRLFVEGRSDVLSRLRWPGLPVYLIAVGTPTNCDSAAGPAWINGPDGGRPLLATAAGVFLPSAYLTVRQQDLSAARQRAEAVPACAGTAVSRGMGARPP